MSHTPMAQQLNIQPNNNNNPPSLESALSTYLSLLTVHSHQTNHLKARRNELKDLINKSNEMLDMTESINFVGSEIGEIVCCLEDVLTPSNATNNNSDSIKNITKYKHSNAFKYIVKVSMGIKYLVSILPSLCIIPISSNSNNKIIRFKKLKPTTRVALDITTLTITHILPIEINPTIHFMTLTPENLDSISFENIGGLNKEIQELREVIELPLINPHLYDRIGIKPPKGVLLYGPPGTGKTLLAKAVAKCIKVNFLSVTASSLIEKYIGESSRMIRELFQYARNNSPAVIFIDEIDAIGSKRSNEHGSCDREVQRTLMELLNQLDGFSGLERVGVVMATNRPDILDEALLRPGRVDRKIEIPLPDVKGRIDILKIYINSSNETHNFAEAHHSGDNNETQTLYADDSEYNSNEKELPSSIDEVINIELIAKLTHGFNGADLRHLVTEAGMNAIRKDREFRVMEDYILAVRKIKRGKGLEGVLEYNTTSGGE
ncbi:26S proteasome regulatory subunit 10B [Cucumispora dikerogammari]|nr:26S proteasome regulatory subunit 10B [Cucumispora dikerogammari]